jgi:hypothetical protein
MAVGVGFEPTEPVKVHFFSKEAHSTTLPPNHLLRQRRMAISLTLKISQATLRILSFQIQISKYSIRHSTFFSAT